MKGIVQIFNPVIKRWTLLSTETASILGHNDTPGPYKEIPIHGSSKCDCTHTKDEHYKGEGACTKCACTWFYPCRVSITGEKGGK